MKLQQFLILTIMIINGLSVSNTADLTVCETGGKSIFTKNLMFEKRTCYFVVENATERTHQLLLSNPSNRGSFEKITNEFDIDLGNSSIPLYDKKGLRVWELKFNYSLNEARRVCCEHNATLIIIRNKSEMLFIKSNFNFTDFHASGQWQRKYKHEPTLKGFALGVNVAKKPFFGDDGTVISCFPPDCEERYTSSGFADYAFLHSDKDAWEIRGFPEPVREYIAHEGNFISSPLGVICQQGKPKIKIELCENMLGRHEKTNTGTVSDHTTVSTIDSKKGYTGSGQESGYECCYVKHGCLFGLIYIKYAILLDKE